MKIEVYTFIKSKKRYAKKPSVVIERGDVMRLQNIINYFSKEKRKYKIVVNEKKYKII